MEDVFVSLANPCMADVGPVGPRSAQPFANQKVIEDTVIVSADNHWEIAEDIFYEGFPKSLKEDAPRVWFDKYWHIGYPGQIEAFGVGERVDRTIERGVGKGVYDSELRASQLEVEGISKEIVYPQSLLGFVRYPKYEIQENMYLVYNEYMAQMAERATDSFYGVGIFSNWWDPAKAEKAMQQIVDLGLKSFMIPITAGKNREGKNLSYGDPDMERFWEVAAESKLPVAFHVGENPDTEHRGGLGTTLLAALGAFRKPLGQLIFGGVFDRHPELNVVFAEGGISWVPSALQDAEMVFDSYGNGDLLDPIKLRPSEYWQRNCYATFQTDMLGLREIEYIGADRVMWGADYPHNEGCYGYSWDSRQSVIDAVGPEKAKRILGGTAMDLYKL